MLDHSTSINCVAWHPLVPSLLVGGSFDGEIVLWDLASGTPDEPVVSVISELASKDPITALYWVFDPAIGIYVVSAVSTDGRLLFWDPRNGLKWPLRGFLLRGRGKGGAGPKAYPAAHGGTSLAISGSTDTKPKWVLVGQQGGGILRGQAPKLFTGSPISEDSFKANQASLPQFRGADDASFAFTPHVGPVTAVHFCPFHRSLFLSAGLDGIVRIYHILESRPLLEWEPVSTYSDGVCGVTSAQFSPIRPTVFAIGLSDGRVLLYDIALTTSVHVAELKSTPNSNSLSTGKRLTDLKPAPITGLSFNGKQRDLIAAVDSRGRVHIWKLGWSLTVRRSSDLRVLDFLTKRVSAEQSSDD